MLTQGKLSCTSTTTFARPLQNAWSQGHRPPSFLELEITLNRTPGIYGGVERLARLMRLALARPISLLSKEMMREPNGLFDIYAPTRGP
ncbi:hypothetical protein ACN38_g11058 [Penicillium nordicum]|uniref:Uncharacterized protein n=1 Tax=Penicillium nordicum TaxID=229535 RepID=A0A0M8P0I6_9EURO|nr:hypothetical protein ACN38_g11058 [Penicillium nordicum]